MNPLTALRAIRALGSTAVALNALYKLGRKTGYFRFKEREKRKDFPVSSSPLLSLFDLPSRQALLTVLGPHGLERLTREADEIVGGKYRLFGGEPTAINLTPPSPHTHWTDLESRLQRCTFDIKLIWEPARFGWAFTLGRAFHVTGSERYAQAFWRFFETFQAANPPYFGENWMNGQEVGLRLMALTWAGQVFRQAEASTPERLAGLAVSIGIHAARIPATLLYARSQNNNHLLTEAAALYTASLALPEHPQAAQWHTTGLRWLNWCFKNQIDPTGEYVQHSANYHRLMLQTALWVFALDSKVSRLLKPENQEIFDSVTRENLTRAVRWLISLLDPISGRVPNLGPNDGAYIFPLTICPFEDYRPAAQAAWLAFAAQRPFQAGPWDEMALWFGLLPPQKELDNRLTFAEARPEIRRLASMHPAPLLSVTDSPCGRSWAYLRTAHFRSRPGHADLLHLDLWWHGLNITLDPGTYSYNASPPWDNALTSTLVHNTITVDGREQMTRVSRFLYLDWADATAQEHSTNDADGIRRISAQTHAYARLGIGHTRTVTVFADEQRWLVQDELLNRRQEMRVFRLHWLLPDWEWQVENRHSLCEVRLQSPQGWVTLKVGCGDLTNPPAITLVRAGQAVWGNLADCPPTRGWFSPTYGVKNPALSLAVEVQSAETVQFTTEFIFPAMDDSP